MISNHISNHIVYLVKIKTTFRIFQNEGISTELYNMKWYLLSTTCQKQVYSTIHLLQNSAMLTIGPFGPVNLETATNVLLIFSVKRLENKINNDLISAYKIHISFYHDVDSVIEVNLRNDQLTAF